MFGDYDDKIISIPFKDICLNKERVGKTTEGLEHINLKTGDIFEWKDNGINYKHYIIDEGQDFCGEHLRLLHDIANEQKGAFYVFYDRNHRRKKGSFL